MSVIVMARKQDIIEFETETDAPRVSLGGVVGALLGALIGYKWAQQTPIDGIPVPLPSRVIVNGETEPDSQVDLISYSLKMGFLAAAGYALGAFLTRARSPKRFMLRHKD